MYKLGTIVKDKASGLKGSLMVMQITGSGNRWYSFQPSGLHKEKQVPMDRLWITEDRVVGEMIPDPDLPIDSLGSEAEDIVTGFNGTVTGLIYHLNGCVHLQIQPKGSNNKTGELVPEQDFDIRMLKGKKIPKFNEKQLEKSKVETPSPMSPVRSISSCMSSSGRSNRLR